MIISVLALGCMWLLVVTWLHWCWLCCGLRVKGDQFESLMTFFESKFFFRDFGPLLAPSKNVRGVGAGFYPLP